MTAPATLRAPIVALLALLPTLVLAGCGDAAISPSATTAAPSAEPATPAIADVLTYRGDNTRTATMPGPGPTEAPIELWHHDADSAYTLQPVVVGGRVIAVSDHGEVIALDAATGVRLGSFNLGAGTTQGTNPAANADTLFVVTADGVLHAVSIASWTERWREPGYDPGSQVAVDGDLVLAAAPGMLVARSVADGTDAWSVPVASSPRIAIAANRAYVGGAQSDTVEQVDLGQHRVTQVMHTGGGEVLTPAAVDDGVIVGYRDDAGGQNGVVAFDLDGQLRWRFAEHDHRIDAVAVDGESIFVYMGTPGVVEVLDRATGEPRGEPHPLGEAGSSVPAIAGGLLYLVVPGAGLLTMDASGGIPWRVSFDGASGPARLVVTGGIVIVPMATPASGGRIVAFAAPSDPRRAVRPSAPAPANPRPSAPPAVTVLNVIDTDANGFVVLPVLAPDGSLYALDWANDRVVAFAPDRTSIRAWGSKGSGRGQLDFGPDQPDAPLGIAVSPDGQLVAVGEGNNHRVQLFDPTGKVVSMFGRLGRDDAQFIKPSGVAVDSQHQVWVADPSRNDVQVFDEAGNHLRTFATPGIADGQLSRAGPPFVREDADEVLVPDFGNRRVAIFTKDGDFVRNIVSDPASGLFFDEVNQVIVDAGGRLFVLDKGAIYVLDPHDHLLGTIPWILPDVGAFEPFGMALGPTGQLFLADPLRHRIIELQLEPPLWSGPEPSASAVP